MLVTVPEVSVHKSEQNILMVEIWIAEEFHDSVFGLRRNHIDECNKFLSRLVSGEIKEFFPNKESYKLKGFLSSLYFECEYFEMNWDEETFYNSIRNGFLKFQKILNEE